MIDSQRPALWVVVDALAIRMEVSRVRVDVDRRRSKSTDLLLEVLLAVLDVADVALDRADGLARIELAVRGNRSVRIVLLGVQLAALAVPDPLNRKTDKTTIAALAARAAVNKVRLGQRQELAVLDRVGRLRRLDSPEGPARAALALVLDRVDNALLAPVDLLRSNAAAGGDRAAVRLARAGSEHAQVLGAGQSGKVVEAKTIGLALVAVEVLDVAESRHEDAEAEVVLVASVEIVGLAHPLEEVALLVHGVQSSARARKKQKHVWRVCLVYMYVTADNETKTWVFLGVRVRFGSDGGGTMSAPMISKWVRGGAVLCGWDCEIFG